LRELNENWTSNLSIHTYLTYLFTLNINNANTAAKEKFAFIVFKAQWPYFESYYVSEKQANAAGRFA
jgi:hypothetical protein